MYVKPVLVFHSMVEDFNDLHYLNVDRWQENMYIFFCCFLNLGQPDKGYRDPWSVVLHKYNIRTTYAGSVEC